MKYRKKPIIVDAEEWCWGKNITGVIWGMDNLGKHAWIETLEGKMMVRESDYIITGIEGERYPCKKSVFEATYEKVEE